MEKLHKIREKLGLKMVPFLKNSGVKIFMEKQLDFIFYRGLELVAFDAISNHGLPDHKPLFTMFKKP